MFFRVSINDRLEVQKPQLPFNRFEVWLKGNDTFPPLSALRNLWMAPLCIRYLEKTQAGFHICIDLSCPKHICLLLKVLLAPTSFLSPTQQIHFFNFVASNGFYYLLIQAYIQQFTALIIIFVHWTQNLALLLNRHEHMVLSFLTEQQCR